MPGSAGVGEGKEEGVSVMWVVEQHEKGGVQSLPVEQVAERNWLALKNGADRPGWLVVGVAENGEAAERLKAVIRRRMREERG